METGKGMAGSTLKIIAVLAMLIDHFSAILLTRIWIVQGYPGDMYDVILFLRLVGRIAFPIFCFLLVEGFIRTRNIRRYMGRMVIFAFLSEIPFDLALTAQVVNFKYQNVMFTMLIGLGAMYVLKIVEDKCHPGIQRIFLQVVVIALAVAISVLGKVDYSWAGILCICAFYLYKASNARKALLGNAALIMISTLEVAGLFSVPLIGAYNGKRGLKMKYFFYLFYPVHMLGLYIICVYLGMGAISTLQY